MTAVNPSRRDRGDRTADDHLGLEQDHSAQRNTGTISGHNSCPRPGICMHAISHTHVHTSLYLQSFFFSKHLWCARNFSSKSVRVHGRREGGNKCASEVVHTLKHVHRVSETDYILLWGLPESFPWLSALQDNQRHGSEASDYGVTLGTISTLSFCI